MFSLIFISINIIMLYLILILMSFDPSDPGWMQSDWTGSICNTGGIIGARIADFLFFCFGIVAYVIPIIIILCSWFVLIKKNKINILRYCMTLISIFILFIISCILIQFTVDDVFCFSPGGIIGNILHDIFKINYNVILYITFIILSASIVGTLYLFYNFYIFFLKIIQEKIIHFIYAIYVFFLKKKNQNHRLYKQATFNNRVYPLVFSVQKNALFQNSISNLSNVYNQKKQTSYLHATSHSTSKLNNVFNKHPNQMQFVPLINNIFSQDNNIIKFWINQSKFDFDQIKYHRIYNIRYHNNIYSSINKNLNTINKNTKNNQSRKLFYLFPKRQIIKNNSSLFRNIHASSINNQHGLSKQKKIISIDFNKNQFHSQSQIDNRTIRLTHQKKIYCYDNTQSTLPDINLLIKRDKSNTATDCAKLKKISQLIEKKLSEYRIAANVATVISGPIITRFGLNLSAGIKSSKITSLSRDLARSLSVSSVRVIEVIPGTPYVGLEIPNEKRNTVYLKDIIDSNKFRKNDSPLSLVLGKDISGQPVIEDLKYMPHLLVAGTTGSGKSVGINVMIISILYKSTPEDVRFIMIDPKILELSIYSNIPHLLKDIVTNIQDVECTLQWCIEEMERRYKLMSTLGVRNLESYNNRVTCSNFNLDQIYNTEKSFNQPYINNITLVCKKTKKLPYIVIIIDEFSDLMIVTGKKIEILIIRLTQKARAAGIHIILSTQRPSVDVITGVIKANIPARIAFTVSSNIDSRTIIGQAGAESLLGMGDMLYLPSNSSIPVRIHGAHITDTEICAVVDFWKKQTNFM